MRIVFLFFAVLGGAAAFSAEQSSALEACKAVPRTQQKAIARIVGREGKPLPEKWWVLVHDAETEKGLREYTIMAGTVVASRDNSEHAQSLTKNDVIGLSGIKFDAPELAELAASYADANEVTPMAFNYELRKDGEDAAPLWKISALDDAGATLGEIVVTANTGTLVTQTGFSRAPELKDLAAMAEVESLEESNDDKSAEKATGAARTRPKSSSGSTNKKPDTFRKIGGKLQKFFTGKNTIGR